MGEQECMHRVSAETLKCNGTRMAHGCDMSAPISQQQSDRTPHGLRDFTYEARETDEKGSN